MALAAMLLPGLAVAAPPGPVSVTTVTTGLEGASGSTIGPDGALYVTEGAVGRVLRIDRTTGETTTFASGLPRSLIGLGGAMDVAFLAGTAHVIVTVVSPQVGGSDVVGVYRVDGPQEVTPIADIGAWAIANPPPPGLDFQLVRGVQFAMTAWRGDLLVTDGHHNRVLRVTPDGDVSEFLQFDNVVPTGLEVRGHTVYVGLAGPVPHLPADGRVVAFDTRTGGLEAVATGTRLLVDVEFGPGRQLFTLSQGEFTPGLPAGASAEPGTGALMLVDDGVATTVVAPLDRPTSIEVVGNTAWVVTHGAVQRIDGLTAPPHVGAR